MKLLIDDARIDQIRKICDVYPVDGVTTNPTILAKARGRPYDVLREIRAFLGPEADLHVQAVSREAAGILAEARQIGSVLGANTYVKIPALPEGFKAMKLLRRENRPFTATAIYTPMQAFLAGKQGAAYVAPYVNRIDNMGFDGVQVAKDIHDIYKHNGMPTQVVAASFKNSQQLLELCKYGLDAATAAPDIIEALVKNPAIDAAVEAFIADFEGLAGLGATMADC